MSISRLRPDDVPVYSQTVLVTSPGTGLGQVFDLGQIRAVYAEATLVAENPDGEIIGPDPGEHTWTASFERSRDSIDYTDLDADSEGTLFYDGTQGALPIVIRASTGVAPRYVKFTASLGENGGGVYAGANFPTADWSIYVEYV